MRPILIWLKDGRQGRPPANHVSEKEIVMQYDAQTPTEYLSMLDEDWRKARLMAIRELILSHPAKVAEVVDYKMLGYQVGGKVVCHLNAQAAYVAFYVGNIEKVDPKGDMLPGLSLGKGCVRFKKKDELGDSRIDEFIDKALRMADEGRDIDC
jgi:uncharacterized protein YdhG (YjbR/CyaY superfamily)